MLDKTYKANSFIAVSLFLIFSKKLLSKKVKRAIIYLRSKKVKKIELKYIP